MSHTLFEWREAFLAALRQMPVVMHACRAVGIERSTAYRRRADDKDFAQAWDEAMEDGIDRAEQEAFRRGVDGWEEPVVHQGNLTPVYKRDANGHTLFAPRVRKVRGDDGEVAEKTEYLPVQETDAQGRPVWLTVRKHSDTMLGLVLKGRRKKVYAERTELTGADGADLQVQDDTAKLARLAALIEIAKSRKQADDFSDVA